LQEGEQARKFGLLPNKASPSQVANTLVDVDLITDDIMGFDNEILVPSRELSITDLDLTARAAYPIAVSQWIAAGNTPDPYAPPVPSSISDRQFFQQLAIAGIITQDQALASNAAVMPADQQFAAKMLVSGATVFERHHEMTEAIGAAYGWTPAQTDAFFRAASAL
jgi:hypothetical protein